MKMNDLGSDFSKSYLIYIEECLGTFYSKHPSGPHLPLCPGQLCPVRSKRKVKPILVNAAVH